MRRIRRIIFNTLSAVSALLFAGTAALWLWSVLAPDTYHLILDWHDIKFGCTQGHLLYEGPPNRPTTYVIYAVEDLDIPTTQQNTTTVYQNAPTTYQGIGPTVFLIRCWRAALACAILPAVWLGLWYKRRPPRPRLCPSCGYDLRATPNRCPECGRAPSVR